MIVSIVLDTEYMGMGERKKWFLKMLSEARKTDMLIVTHEYMKVHLNEIIDECSERFYREFEMDKVTAKEAALLNVCYIPDELFDNIYKRAGTRSKMILELVNTGCERIYEYVLEAIDKELARREEERPNYLLNCLHVFRFTEKIAANYKVPIIPYVFSAIRKVHGYEQTLYMAHIDNRLFNSGKFKEMYESQNEYEAAFPFLSRREILALIGKKYNMFLFPLLESEPVYDVGVVGEGFHVTPEIYQEYPATDDDIFYEIKQLKPDAKVISRLHPMQLDQVGFGRDHMKNDPASFVLSCEKVATIQSQMILKAILWKRTAIAKSNALPYSFVMDNSISSDKIVSDEELNFIIFGYLVPDICMFDAEYWKWRLTGPSVSDIMKRHAEAIFEALGIEKSILFSKKRLYELLKRRGFSEYEIEQITRLKKVNTDYKFPLSILYAKENRKVRTYYSLNETVADNTYQTSFHLEENASELQICLQNDVDGYLSVNTVLIDGCPVNLEDKVENQYFSKGENTFVIQLKSEMSMPIDVDIEWKGTYFNDKVNYLKGE